MNRPKIATYYGRLKVAPDAPPEVIRAAYKVLVQKYHPDRHQGSFRHEIVLAALNKAQDVLLDPARRAAHDQWIRQEEIRLGWREPDGPPPGFLQRCELAMASWREDGLGPGEAWRLNFTTSQRVATVAGATLLLLALAGGAAALLMPAEEPPLRLPPAPRAAAASS